MTLETLITGMMPESSLGKFMMFSLIWSIILFLGFSLLYVIYRIFGKSLERGDFDEDKEDSVSSDCAGWDS